MKQLIKYLAFMIVGLQLSGCAKFTAPHELYIQEPFVTYVDRFKGECHTHRRPITIDNLILKFVVNIKDPTIYGLCYATSTPMIVISSTKWLHLSEEGREQLIFHELGHCLFGRHHDDSYIRMGEFSIPRTLMISYQIDDYTYHRYHEYYMQEFFGY